MGCVPERLSDRQLTDGLAPNRRARLRSAVHTDAAFETARWAGLYSREGQNGFHVDCGVNFK
jgi:hypothetical protein